MTRTGAQWGERLVVRARPRTDLKLAITTVERRRRLVEVVRKAKPAWRLPIFRVAASPWVTRVELGAGTALRQHSDGSSTPAHIC